MAKMRGSSFGFVLLILVAVECEPFNFKVSLEFSVLQIKNPDAGAQHPDFL